MREMCDFFLVRNRKLDGSTNPPGWLKEACFKTLRGVVNTNNCVIKKISLFGAFLFHTITKNTQGRVWSAGCSERLLWHKWYTTQQRGAPGAEQGRFKRTPDQVGGGAACRMHQSWSTRSAAWDVVGHFGLPSGSPSPMQLGWQQWYCYFFAN